MLAEEHWLLSTIDSLSWGAAQGNKVYKRDGNPEKASAYEHCLSLFRHSIFVIYYSIVAQNHSAYSRPTLLSENSHYPPAACCEVYKGISSAFSWSFALLLNTHHCTPRYASQQA